MERERGGPQRRAAKWLLITAALTQPSLKGCTAELFLPLGASRKATRLSQTPCVASCGPTPGPTPGRHQRRRIGSGTAPMVTRRRLWRGRSQVLPATCRVTADVAGCKQECSFLHGRGLKPAYCSPTFFATIKMPPDFQTLRLPNDHE